MTDILQYNGYFASVGFCAEDGVFFGKIIGVNDSFTFEGNSVNELIQAFHEAVDDYLKTCKKLGKEPGKLYKGSFNVRIPSELHRQATLYPAVITDKKFTMDVIVDETVQDCGNDPAIQERARKAIAFLKKHGVPKSLSKKK